jgi:hypothetical protein
MDERLGVLESPRARGRVPSERRHFVLGARKWMHGPERNRRRAFERKFDMEAIPTQRSVPKDQLPSKYSSELDDRDNIGDRLGRKYSPAAVGFVCRAAFGAWLSGMFRTRISWPCDARVKPRQLKYQENFVLQQAQEHAKEQAEEHVTAHVTEHVKEHTKAYLTSTTSPVCRQWPCCTTPQSVRHHSSLDRRVQEILEEWDCAERESFLGKVHLLSSGVGLPRRSATGGWRGGGERERVCVCVYERQREGAFVGYFIDKVKNLIPY